MKTDRDDLHAEIRAEIQQHYREINKITCPWDGSEGRALDKMLKANPSWTLIQWTTMIRNYFDSEGINGQRPRVWLPQISKWAAGPLDKYGHVQGSCRSRGQEMMDAIFGDGKRPAV